MPSTRRSRVILTLVAISIFLIFYYTSSARRSHTQDVYDRTVSGLNAQKASEQPITDSSISQKLKDAENAAKEVAKSVKEKVAQEVAQARENSVGKLAAEKPLRVSEDDSKRLPKKLPTKGEKWDLGTGKEAPGSEKEKPIVSPEETEAEHEVEAELNLILKKSPIIIFSKSYCPHSARAKRILLEKYNIMPAPYVEELDKHPLGPRLQEKLSKTTGRRTVPNILINGKSIGGGDEVAQLDSTGALEEKVRDMGGKRIMEVKIKE